MESTWPSMPSFKKDTLWPDFLKTHFVIVLRAVNHPESASLSVPGNRQITRLR